MPRILLHRSWLRPVVLLLAGGCFAASSVADEPALDADAPPAAASEVIAPSDIEALRSRLTGPDGAALSEEQKKQVAALAQQALDDLAAAEKLRADAERFNTLKQNLTTERDELAGRLVAIASEEDRQPDMESSLATLETELLARRQELAEAAARSDEWTASVQARPGRRESLRNALVSQQKQLADANAQLQTTPPAGDPALLTEAVRAAVRARRMRLERLPEAATAELSYYDAVDALEVPRLRREVLDRVLARRQREVAAWEEAVQSTRRDVIGLRLGAALEAAANAVPTVREIYEGNAEIAKEERTVRRNVADVVSERDAAAGALDDLQRRFDRLEERESKAAGSAALGLRLRQERERLADPEALRQEIANRLETVEEVRLAALDKSEQLEELNRLDDAVDEYVAEHPAPLSVSERTWRDSILAAMEQRREFLTELVKAYDAYTDALDDLELKQVTLADLLEQVRRYIDERVLWIRSHRAITFQSLAEVRSSLGWLSRGEPLQECVRVLRADAWSRPGWYALFVVVVATLQLRHSRLRRRLEELARVAVARSHSDISPTLQALAVTIMLSLLWPAVVMFFAFRLQGSAEASQITRNLAHNLYALAAIILLLEFTRNLVRVDGLADAHFQWSERVRTRLTKWTRRLTLCGLPAALLIAVLNAGESFGGDDVAERIVFTALLLFLAWALRDLLDPRSGVLLEWVRLRPGGWLDRLRPLWSLAVLLVPLVLAALTLYGHYYTAQRLAEKLVQSLVLLESAVVLRELLIRWLMLRHRRLSIEQARARRAALAEPAFASDESIARVVELTEPKADLSESSTQSQRLLNTSLVVITATAIWFVWADVLPALNYLNTTPVWPTYETVVRTTPLPGDGEAPIQVAVEIENVTWADLIRVLVVIVLTVTAARNLPGLLEITILERLPIDAAVRYAVQVFARYTIILLGMVVASKLLGLNWSNIQWLAAALTFGLAFGLQEIFANFVSGLIILSEQPVRLGDIVTIDNVSGVVSGIRMRSTTITDWDHKEYIVPNKEFITGRLLNWTLTDTLNRIVIPVGVSYAAEPEQVRRVMQEIAEAHDYVLKDPAPNVTFDGFGESALNFTLRAFLPGLERRQQTTHELHTQIFLRFREEGIEIPFPQRDVHLRTSPDPSLHLAETGDARRLRPDAAKSAGQ